MEATRAPPPSPSDGALLSPDVIKGPEVRPGTFRYNIRGHLFDIPVRYTPLKLIGQGAYGIVCSAKDRERPEEDSYVAIKKMILKNNEIHWKRTLREIRLLRHFDNENILGLWDIFELPNPNEINEIYIVTELMDTDLHQIIRSPQPLSDDHCQLFLFQMLRGLKYIHSAHVLHRDLKPSNLFINKDCLLKIADFGLARMADPQENHDGFMTEYVTTRWYRAPEVILSWKQYTKAIDIWAVGCIFIELLYRKPLFTGSNYVDQIECICKVLGTPSEEDMACIQSESAQKFIRSLGFKPKIDFRNLLPYANPLAIDLLEKLLAFNPNKRPTAEEALAHPYLSVYHDPEDEPSCHSAFDFSFEQWDLNNEVYQKLIYEEMLHYHPEAAQRRYGEPSSPMYLPQLFMQPQTPELMEQARMLEHQQQEVQHTQGQQQQLPQQQAHTQYLQQQYQQQMQQQQVTDFQNYMEQLVAAGATPSSSSPLPSLPDISSMDLQELLQLVPDELTSSAGSSSNNNNNNNNHMMLEQAFDASTIDLGNTNNLFAAAAAASSSSGSSSSSASALFHHLQQQFLQQHQQQTASVQNGVMNDGGSTNEGVSGSTVTAFRALTGDSITFDFKPTTMVDTTHFTAKDFEEMNSDPEDVFRQYFKMVNSKKG